LKKLKAKYTSEVVLYAVNSGIIDGREQNGEQ